MSCDFLLLGALFGRIEWQSFIFTTCLAHNLNRVLSNRPDALNYNEIFPYSVSGLSAAVCPA